MQIKITEGYKISEGIDYKYGIAKSKVLRCRILMNMNRLEELKKLEEVLEYSNRHNLKDMLGDIYNLKGLLEYFSGNLERSIDYYNKRLNAIETGQYIDLLNL